VLVSNVTRNEVAPVPPSSIEAHVAIGDGRSVALTDGRGAIDWLCWPRFDSDPVFAAILDGRRGGFFRIAPRHVRRSGARYVDGSNVAITQFDLDGAGMELVDAMAIDPDGTHERSLAAEHEIMRVISCTYGGGEVDVTIDPRPAFGARRARGAVEPSGTVRFDDRGRLITLRSSRAVSWREDASGALSCSFSLGAGDAVAFSLSFAADAPLVLSPLLDVGRATLETTTTTWRAWASKARYEGPYRAAVVRSALALKLLCYAPSGAIVAAPTTSLPERRGSDLNWDYRFCWLRDAAFTARALFGLGYEDEADAFVGWLLHATHLTRPELCVLYDVFGEQPVAEREIVSFAGYGGARPVRVGNAAANQIQLDLYGEVIDAVAQAWSRGRAPDRAEVEMLVDFGEFVAENWQAPDQGIWETRSAPEHHVHSRVLCWVALDRLLRLVDGGMIRLRVAARERFERERARIAEEVRGRGYSPALGSYVSTLDGDRLDACLLLLSWYGFEAPSSARMSSTFAALERTLGIGGQLLRRNLDLADGGGFVACAFWAAEHLARGGGTVEEARRRFETLLRLASPSGLYGEIVEPSGTHLGNYPQGFSHLALLNAALSLEQREAGR
jgi:GH15 family glucan-1,4-alpha-glucosidase